MGWIESSEWVEWRGRVQKLSEDRARTIDRGVYSGLRVPEDFYAIDEKGLWRAAAEIVLYEDMTGEVILALFSELFLNSDLMDLTYGDILVGLGGWRYADYPLDMMRHYILYHLVVGK